VTRHVLRHSTPVRRGVLAAGLVVALLFAQWLGLAHRIAHAPAMPGNTLRAVVQPAHVPGPTTAHAEHEHDDAVWSHDSGTAECRLFDPLCSADGLPTFGPALPDAVPAQRLTVAPAHTSLPRLAFAQAQARAPPVRG
jgi:hypothetical protein